MKHQRNTLVAFLASLALLVALVAPLWLSGPAHVTAAPGAAPTPVTNNSSGIRSDVLTFWSTKVITSDQCSPAISTLDHEKVDLQYVIDVKAGAVNTTTFSLRHSNVDNSYDTTNWNVGPTVASAISADGSVSQQYLIFNRWNCIYADVTNSQPLTVTWIGVAR